MASVTLEAPMQSELREDEILYEVVDGQRVEKPAMSTPANQLGFDLAHEMQCVAKPNKLGRVVTEPLFGLDPENRNQRRPDAAFVSYERWPKDLPLPNSDPWEVIPNIAVEVVSPTNKAPEMMKKVEEYFHAGVELVWVVHPDQAKVYVYQSPTDVRILTRQDELDGGKVLPNFRLKLSDLLPQPA